jgi:hypothetical protein
MSSEPKGRWASSEVMRARASPPETYQLRSTLPLIPGTVPLSVYCQNVQPDHGVGTSGRGP